MRFKMILVAALSVMALALAAACGGDSDEAPPPDQPVDATPLPGAPPTPDRSVPVAAAREHLAQGLGVSVDAVEVISVEAVDWPNACLGAAGPNEACAEIITPGYRIVLAVDTTEYVYHTNADTHVRPVP